MFTLLEVIFLVDRICGLAYYPTQELGKYFESIADHSSYLKTGFNKQHNLNEQNDEFYEYEFTRKWIFIPGDEDTQISVSMVTPISNDNTETFPVLFEYMPYRKDDSLCYTKDWEEFDYFGKRGYIVLRADIRGTGSSLGTLPQREYSDIEMSDAQYIINWAATQYSKSNGNVGMFGISWSAINSLILSLIEDTPYLKTIFIFDAADDLYYNDIHYIDGSLHIDADYMIYTSHATGLPSPINPILNDNYYNDRFNQKPWLFKYIEQQNDGTWWRNKSVKFNITNSNIPIYLWSGQLDGYRDYSINIWNKQLFHNIKMTIGPWEHAFSATSWVDPKVEWKHQADRWFNWSLRNGDDSIIKKEPKIAMYVRHYTEGQDGLIIDINGEWRTYDTLTNTENMTLFLTDNYKLQDKLPATSDVHTLKYNPIKGIYNQNWWGQNVDLGNIVNETNGIDGLIYDTDTLSNMYEIIGFVGISLRVSSSITIPRVDWVVRLEDFNPETDESVVVTGANRNSANIINNNRLNPTNMIANTWYDIQLQLHWTTWQFPKGHKIRIVITNAAYPMLWSLNANKNELSTNIMVNNLKSFIILPISNMHFNPITNQWIVFNSSENSLGQPAFINDNIELYVPNNACLYGMRPREASSYNVTVYTDGYTDTNMIEIISHTQLYTSIGDKHLFGLPHISLNQYDWKMYLNDTNPFNNTFEANARTVVLYDRYVDEDNIMVFDNLGYAACLVPPPLINFPHKESIDLHTNIIMNSDEHNFYITIIRTIYEDGVFQKERTFNEIIPRSFQ